MTRETDEREVSLILASVIKSMTFEPPKAISAEDAGILFPEFAPALTKSFSNFTLLSLDSLIEKAKEARLSTEDPGLFTRCLETKGAKKSTNPKAYCAAIHQRITGRWPAEDPKEKKK